jgi:hypothetical protein
LPALEHDAGQDPFHAARDDAEQQTAESRRLPGPKPSRTTRSPFSTATRHLADRHAADYSEHGHHGNRSRTARPTSRAVNGNPSINTQRATTQVQVADGVTTVIGGILQTTEQSNLDQTPGVSRVPLLGWLFKRQQNSNESQELLIFITPRIIRG